MHPKAYIHHELPFRIRFYIPSRKGEDDFFQRLQIKINDCDEVDGAEVNSKTGSAVIYYHGAKQKIVEFAEKNQLFSVHPEADLHAELHPTPAKRISERIINFDHQLAEKSHGEMDLSTLTATGLVGLALVQVMNGRLLPPAWTLMSQAISAIRNGPSRS